MRKITLILVFCILAFGCSDDNSGNAGGDLKLSGTIMSPNHTFPISRAAVKVFKDGSVISQTTADALGHFEITNLPEGTLTVELSKGKFKKEVVIEMEADYELDMAERNLDIFPRIAVVTGSFDEIEQVLINIGLVNPLTQEPLFDIIDGFDMNRPAVADNHGRSHLAGRAANSMPTNVSFGFADLLNDPNLLDNYDIIFLNCGASDGLANDPVATANLAAYVADGGILYATDWMYKYLQGSFDGDEYLTFTQPEKNGTSLDATAQIFNADLLLWLQAQGITADAMVEINDFLPSWQMVDTFNPDNVMSWLVADVVYDNVPVAGKPLAFTFQHGDGGVFYSSFHTHGDDPSQDAIVQLMNYFVFELSAL